MVAREVTATRGGQPRRFGTGTDLKGHPMLPTEDLFVYVYVLIDDLVTARIIAIPPRAGPAPASSDAELRCHLSRQAPADDCQQIDTSALPVKHTSRARGPDSWTGPGGLHAGSAATPRTPAVHALNYRPCRIRPQTCGKDSQLAMSLHVSGLPRVAGRVVYKTAGLRQLPLPDLPNLRAFAAGHGKSGGSTDRHRISARAITRVGHAPSPLVFSSPARGRASQGRPRVGNGTCGVSVTGYRDATPRTSG